MTKRRFWKKSAAGAVIATLLFAGALPVTTPLASYVGVSVAHAEGTTATVADLNISSESGLLMDASTGQILWAKKEHEKRYPASVTKVMTMLLALEAVEKGEKQLTDIVPISDTAYGVEGSSVWLDPSEKFTLAEMIEFISIPSANDACVATAQFIAGSEEAFVARMNKKAQELGMKDTHFADTNGLHKDDHFSSAYDIALMSRELITKYPDILQTTKIQSKMIRDGKFKLENTNHVLGRYDGLDGLKTGFTDQAGYCLSATADRGGFRLISVQLLAKDDMTRVDDTIKILDHGFTNFKQQDVIKKGAAAPEKAPVLSGKETEVEAVAKDDLKVAMKNGANVEKKVVWNQVEAPVAKDAVLGQMQVVENGNVVASVDLVANQDVEKGSWLRLLFRSIGDFVGNLF